MGDESDDGHGHAAPTLVSKLASSLVCFIIYFVFCIVFSSVVWDPLSGATSKDLSINPPYGIPQGVGINLMGIAVGSVFFAWRSGCNAVMAGTDLLPVVFFAETGQSVLTFLISDYQSRMCGDAGAYAADDAHRFLGGGGGGGYAEVDPCGGAGGAQHRFLAEAIPTLDADAYAMVVPTTLVAMIIGNLVTGLLFYGLGRMKNVASVIGCIPSSVVAGFLTCIGYKVIKLAVLITTGYSFKEKYVRQIGDPVWHKNDPWVPLLIALVYGVLLYGLKHLHVMAAEKLIMGFIIAPLVLFYAICAIAGTDMDELRDMNWFLTQNRDGLGCEENCAFTTVNFWQTIQVAYGGLFGGKIAWGAIPRCIPIWIMGACMSSLDSMLKLTSSEKALSIDFNYNHEMKLGGKATLISSFLCGTPAYGQTKFNVINLSIAKTADSSLPTMGLAGLSTLVFLSGVAGPIINIMPRFLLGGLCVFAGVGFLFENLYEGRKNMNRVSFAIVWIIFLVNFIWEFFVLQNLPKEIQPMVPGLLVVFILGIVLSTFEFMFAFMHKAKDPEIKYGHEVCSSAVRSEKHDNQLATMSPWFQVFSAESFVFFGTANNLYQQLKKHLADQKTGENAKPKAERTKYLIFDLTEVTGIDSSAKDVFFKVHRLLKTEGIKLIWAMRVEKLKKKFDAWGLYVGTSQHDSLDLALRHVEDSLLQRAHTLSGKWLVNDTVKRIFERQVLANVFNISVRSDEKNFSSARLQPWSNRIIIQAGEEICGEDDDNLYMLYAGEVKITGRDNDSHSVFTGSFFNLDRLLISVGALPGFPSTLGAVATEDSMVLVVSRKNFMIMQKEDGALAQKLLMTLIVQNESNRPGRIRVKAGRGNGMLNTTQMDASRKSLEARLRTHAIPGMKNMATRLLTCTDYKINLTEAQMERFGEIFDMIVAEYGEGEDEIPMEIFAKYVSQEARALGSQIEHQQFMDMIDASGIDEDGDGSLAKEEFLTFLRQLFLADIPTSEIPGLKEAYDAAVALDPDAPMDECRVQVLFELLGFNVECSGWKDVVGVIDADGDGDVDFDEFLTGVGMMKEFMLHASQLDAAFKHYKKESEAKKSLMNRGDMRSLLNSAPQADNRRSMMMRGMSTKFGKPVSERNIRIEPEVSKEEPVELDASDLEAFLSIPRAMAEEMVFLADQDEVDAEEGEDGEVEADRTIDREEFQQLIRSWS